MNFLLIATLLTARFLEGESAAVNAVVRRVVPRPEQSAVEIQIQNNYKKPLTSLGVSYSVGYGTGNKQILAATSDCAIPPRRTRYVSFALPETGKNASAARIGDVLVTFVIFADDTAAGDEELVSQAFERRAEEAAELNRWAPEFEAAAKAADPAAAMEALAIRLSGETDDPAILGAMSETQKTLRKMADAWVQAGGPERRSIVEMVHRMQQSAAAHATRRN